MNAENMVHFMGCIDDALIDRAESRVAGRTAPGGRRGWKRVAAWAACLVLAATLGVSAASSTGFLDRMQAYLGGETEMYLEEILASVASVSNEEMELRIDGAVADEHACHMIISFVGVTGETKKRFSAGDLEEQEKFELYAISKAGERVDFPNTESGTYTEEGMLHRAKTMLADADMTYLVSGTFRDGGMKDMAKVCFAFEDLVLELDVQEHIAPEYELYPEDPETGLVTDLRISRVGFYFTMPTGEDFKLLLIREDGSLFEMGYRASGGHTDEEAPAYVSGSWSGDSPVSIGLIDPEDYLGIQINGENYYFYD